jgi:EAL domain-containing protein (putative c-di-GMP-specific phosphodiesterase class I)
MQSFGCDLGQGYLFARPMPADQLTDLLTNDTPQFAPDEAVA